MKVQKASVGRRIFLGNFSPGKRRAIVAMVYFLTFAETESCVFR